MGFGYIKIMLYLLVLLVYDRKNCPIDTKKLITIDVLLTDIAIMPVLMKY